MTHDAQARAKRLVHDWQQDPHASIDELEFRIAVALERASARRTWTDKPPTDREAWYWWRKDPQSDPKVVDGGISDFTFGGQWARIELPEDKP